MAFPVAFSDNPSPGHSGGTAPASHRTSLEPRPYVGRILVQPARAKKEGGRRAALFDASVKAKAYFFFFFFFLAFFCLHGTVTAEVVVAPLS